MARLTTRTAMAQATILAAAHLLILLMLVSPALAKQAEEDPAPGRKLARMAAQKDIHAPGGSWTTADHSKHEALNKDFATAEEVTAACLSCHTEAAKQIQHTIHWTWICPKSDPEKPMGKYGLTLNNFCIAVPSNEPRCTSCHVGFGWKDASFDFTNQTKVDCIVCHESQHTYKKFPTGAGYPAAKETVFKGNKKTYKPADWKKLAQTVARPDRVNCGTCHFNGGGGDAVKHGDLDSTLVKPSKNLDVHMDAEGLNFSCARCHTTKEHRIAGRCYKSPAAPEQGERLSLTEADLASKIYCESCHSATPHKAGHKANDHTDKVACQSCHIPAFAREKATKMNWDWSTAGKKKDGKPFQIPGPHKKPSYDSKKGDFVWEKNVQPEYRWYSGGMEYVLVTDKIDPNAGPVAINHPIGDPDDPNARIMPFKVHRGKQPYDSKNNTFVFPHLFGKKGSGAYWGDWDWKKAIEGGMAAKGLPFSGEYGFVETEYYYQTTHMVAPKENSVACNECHVSQGRLEGIHGVYMPGRDASSMADMFGWGAVIASLIAVVIHGLGRALLGGRK